MLLHRTTAVYNQDYGLQPSDGYLIASGSLRFLAQEKLYGKTLNIVHTPNAANYAGLFWACCILDS